MIARSTSVILRAATILVAMAHQIHNSKICERLRAVQVVPRPVLFCR
jgi:hypothetical protein